MAASGPPTRNVTSIPRRIQATARSVARSRGLPSSPRVRASRAVLGGRAGIALTMITSSFSYCHGYCELPVAIPCYLRDAIEDGQRPAIFVRVRKP
jgi:hypothetical protein